MRVINSITEMKAVCQSLKREGSLGFVPTMGYLHEGHLSLVDQSVSANRHTVVSIFVNPAQFGRNEDLSTYPRDLDRDLELLQSRGTDYVFYPDAAEIYPSEHQTWVEVEKLSVPLCGKSRPGHFRGVATIVLKLVNIVQPDYMYMGSKDFQQVVVLERMLADLNLDTVITRCPIIRETDGLAMSSRNSYLDADERIRARCLSQALITARHSFALGERGTAVLIAEASRLIETAGANIDYVECVDPKLLTPVETAEADTRMVMAVFIGRTRLIDNGALGS